MRLEKMNICGQLYQQVDCISSFVLYYRIRIGR